MTDSPPEKPDQKRVYPVRYVTIKVRCTPEERQAWQKKANDQGMTVSDLLRRGADMDTGKRKQRPIKRKVVELDPTTVRHLAGIGNNLNQLAKAVNTYGFEPSDSARLLTYLAAVRKELELLRTAAVLTDAQ